jgi:hypothetical protein
MNRDLPRHIQNYIDRLIYDKLCLRVLWVEATGDLDLGQILKEMNLHEQPTVICGPSSSMLETHSQSVVGYVKHPNKNYWYARSRWSSVIGCVNFFKSENPLIPSLPDVKDRPGHWKLPTGYENPKTVLTCTPPPVIGDNRRIHPRLILGRFLFRREYNLCIAQKLPIYFPSYYGFDSSNTRIWKTLELVSRSEELVRTLQFIRNHNRCAYRSPMDSTSWYLEGKNSLGILWALGLIRPPSQDTTYFQTTVKGRLLLKLNGISDKTYPCPVKKKDI